MSSNEEDKIIGGPFKTIAEIAGYIATVVPFLLALLGKSSLPYPTFVATVVLVFSVLFLWRWRWFAITKTKTKRRSKVKLREVLGESKNQMFVASLGRRRTELLMLTVFSLGTLGVAGTNFTTILEEFTGFHCLPGDTAFRVIIADFSSSPTFEDDLAAILHQQSGDRYQICRYRKQVRLPDAAQKAGEDKHAQLVVWGIKNSDTVNVYLAAIDWETLNERYGGLSVGQSPEEAAFLAEIISAEIFLNQGQAVAAQESLYNALDAAVIQSWTQTKPALLAKGYFELGMLLDPNIVPEEAANSKRAIKEYSEAISIMQKQDLYIEGAYLNRAQLYYDQHQYDLALTDYSVLLDHDTEQANSVYVMRAQAFIDSGRCANAVDELEKARQQNGIEDDPMFPYITFYLGLASLRCGNLDLAEKTYQTMPPLSAEDATAFLEDLNALAGASNDPAAKEVINRIMEHLRKLESN